MLNNDYAAAERVVFQVFPHIFTGDSLFGGVIRNNIDQETFSADKDFTLELIKDDYDGDCLWYAFDTCAYIVEEMVKAFCWPTLRVEEKPQELGRATAGWGTTSLLGAMYLQMYWLMEAGGEVTRCRWCGRLISLVSPQPSERKVRQDKKFCNNACRQRYHYHTRTRPRRNEGTRPYS